jgi:hypothetical protein
MREIRVRNMVHWQSDRNGQPRHPASFLGDVAIRGEGKGVGKARLQLDEATAPLASVLRTSAISELETQVGELKASSNNITADLEAASQNFENAKLGSNRCVGVGVWGK